MTPLTDRLEAVASQIEAIVSDGKVSVLEIVDTFKILTDAVKETITELPEAPTEAEVKDMLENAWQWADEKYKLVDKADAFIKLPPIAEAVDGAAIRFIVEKAIIPSIAKKLAA